MKLGDLDSAIRMLRASLELVPPRLDDKWLGACGESFYQLACFLALSGDNALAQSFLESAVAHGYGSSEMVVHDHDLGSLWGVPEFWSLVERMQENEQRMVSLVQRPSVRKVLLLAAARDQQVRSEWLAEPSQCAKWADVDVKNARLLAGICEKIQWPTRSLVGHDGAEAAWLVAQHCDADVALQSKFLARMRRAGRVPGEICRVQLAYLEDRLEVNRHGSQFYGTQQWGTIRESGTVERRRRELGMCPLWYYREMLRDLDASRVAAGATNEG